MSVFASVRRWLAGGGPGSSFSASTGGRRLALTAVVMTGMLGLLLLQLTWWLVFFEIRNEEYRSVLTENDFLRVSLANGARPERMPDGSKLTDGLELRDGVYSFSSRQALEREAIHRRRRFMLISETVFLMGVLMYGHYRIIRALRHEWRLVSDRNNLIQSVTHELKTPLSAASLHLQTLRKRDLDPAERNELLDESIADLKRLEDQINNLLTGSALLRGKVSTDSGKVAVDAAALLSRYRSRSAPYLRERSVALAIDAPEPIDVRLDANLLEKVITNLIQNAVQHAPAGSTVAVRLERDPQDKRYCLLRVEDRGPGIAAEDREKVFQPLMRLESPDTDHRGSGMGLYIVREILNAAGGSVRLLAGENDRGLVAEARMLRA